MHITLDSDGIDVQKAHQNVIHSMAKSTTLKETNIQHKSTKCTEKATTACQLCDHYLTHGNKDMFID